MAKKKGKKEKKAKKKKLTKREKELLALQQAEEARLEAERQRQKQIQEEKALIEEEQVETARLAKQTADDQAKRVSQLHTTISFFKNLERSMYEMDLENRQNQQWEQYLKCDGLPDPADPTKMNTYLYLWERELPGNSLDKTIEKTEEVLKLLDVLEEMIDYPLDASKQLLENWKEVRNDFRAQLQCQIDDATYKLLRKMEDQMEIIGLNEVRFNKKSSYIKISLWALLPLPPTSFQSPFTAGMVLKSCEFPDLGISVQLPEALAKVDLVIRALQLTYDHLTDLCPSRELALLPPDEFSDLNAITVKEYEEKAIIQKTVDAETNERIKYRQKVLAQVIAQAAAASAAAAAPLKALPQTAKTVTQVQPEEEIDLSILKTLPAIVPAANRFSAIQDEEELLLKTKMTYTGETCELNLRKYTILAGVTYLDLLEQLPQPFELPEKFILTTLQVPIKLKEVNFKEIYVPPAPPEPGQIRTPEEIEAEMKKQEEELEKFAVVSITLPENVLWFEPPLVAHWDKQKQYWSTAYCHDIKFNEEKQLLNFRLGHFGALGLAAYRFVNLPYQTWEMKPDVKSGTVTLSITAAIVIVEFTMKEDKVCLSQLQNGGTAALQEIVGIYYKPHVLKKIMRRGGVDLFPPADAACYVEGSASKHRGAEKHLYHCMALLSTVYNFAWSRWNLLAGRRNMVLQMREYLDRRKLGNHNMLHVTPLRAQYVDCTEVSQGFSPQGVPGMKFYADLYHLYLDHGGIAAKKKIKETPFTITECVYEILRNTKVLSYA